MKIYDVIKDRVSEWHNQHPEGIENFVDDIVSQKDNEIFHALNDFIEYLDIYCLKDRLIKAYIDAKYHLKEEAIKSLDALHDDAPHDLRDKVESAFYDWLKICINPQKDVNYDFYFEKNNLNREAEVSKILFDNDGKLRKIFKSTDWQVRLKTIADWYLRRYNRKKAKEILKPLDWWDRLKLFYPRLMVAIIIGLLALMTGREGWNVPHKLFPEMLGLWGFLCVFLLSISLFAITVLYLTYECYNIISDRKEASKRAICVGGIGYFISFLLSLISCIVVGRILVDPTTVTQYYSVFAGEFTLSNILPVLKNTFFFASASLLIGIFIQIFWEEKTITEPL